MSIRKGLIIEVALIVIFVTLAVLMYQNELDLVFFKTYNTTSLKNYEINLEQKQSALNAARASHKSSLTSLEDAKLKYETEKAAYEAISEDTLSIINEATQGEEYNIEYMWIALGNYAKENNLEVVLYEPGSTVGSSGTGSMQSNLSGRSSENMRIKVQGTYINVSEFIYDLENDDELRFNLDNIRMEYMADNEIAAIFEIKGLILNK